MPSLKLSTLVIVVLSFGCQDLLPGPKLSDDTRLPEEIEGLESVEVQDDRIVYTFSSSSQDVSLDSGHIIVGERGGGYLRRIVSVERSANQLTAMTEQAALVDVLVEGEIAGQLVSAGSDGWSDGCPEGATCKQTTLLDLSGEKLFDGEVAGVPVLVEVTEGGVMLDPTVDVDLAIKRGKLSRFEVVVGGALSVGFEVKITAGGAVNFADEVDLSGPNNVLFSHPFTFFIPTFLGPLPVVGRIDLDVFAGFSAELFAQAAVSTGFDVSAQLELGARYDGSEWTVLGEPGVEASARPVVFEGAASADVIGYIRPEVRSVFYGVGGPGVTLTPELRLHGEYTPPDAVAGTVDGCLIGELNFVLKVFSFELADYETSIERCSQLLEGSFELNL